MSSQYFPNSSVENRPQCAFGNPLNSLHIISCIVPTLLPPQNLPELNLHLRSNLIHSCCYLSTHEQSKPLPLPALSFKPRDFPLLLQAMTLTVAVLVIILTRVLKLKIPRKTKICSLHTSRIVLRLYEKCEKKIREDKQRS